MIHDDHQQLFQASGEPDDEFMVKFWLSTISLNSTYQQFTKIFEISDGENQLELERNKTDSELTSNFQLLRYHEQPLNVGSRAICIPFSLQQSS